MTGHVAPSRRPSAQVRRTSVKRRSPGLNFTQILAVGLIAAFASAIVVVGMSPTFAVRNIQIHGATFTDEAVVRSIVGMDGKPNAFGLDSSGIAATLVMICGIYFHDRTPATSAPEPATAVAPVVTSTHSPAKNVEPSPPLSTNQERRTRNEERVPAQQPSLPHSLPPRVRPHVAGTCRACAARFAGGMWAADTFTIISHRHVLRELEHEYY